MLDKKEFFYCYSTRMRDYLKDNGVPFILTAKAVSNGWQFWLYKYENVSYLVKRYGIEMKYS